MFVQMASSKCCMSFFNHPGSCFPNCGAKVFCLIGGCPRATPNSFAYQSLGKCGTMGIQKCTVWHIAHCVLASPIENETLSPASKLSTYPPAKACNNMPLAVRSPYTSQWRKQMAGQLWNLDEPILFCSSDNFLATHMAPVSSRCCFAELLRSGSLIASFLAFPRVSTKTSCQSVLRRFNARGFFAFWGVGSTSMCTPCQ